MASVLAGSLCIQGATLRASLLDTCLDFINAAAGSRCDRKRQLAVVN
jgi:hypothetical protein